MKTKIITTDEIKKILGISGTSKDGMIDMFNTIATEQLCDLIGVYDLVKHAVIKEPVKSVAEYKIYTRDFPVDINETITLYDMNGNELNGYYWTRDPNTIFSIRSISASEIPFILPSNEMLLSYTAGWTHQDTIQVITNPSDDETFMVSFLGEYTLYTFKTSATGDDEIAIGADENETASNIAEKIVGSVVTGDTVTLPLGYTVITYTTSGLTFINATIPQQLKATIAYLVGGLMAEKNKVGGVVSYRIGTKQVNFRSESEKNFVSTTLNKFANKYNQVNIASI